MSEAAVIMRHPGETHASCAGVVLIIDDEAAIRESLETLLELEGYAVESASSGEEGVARLSDRSFDLVLLDLALPDRNGIDLLAEIQDHHLASKLAERDLVVGILYREVRRGRPDTAGMVAAIAAGEESEERGW